MKLHTIHIKNLDAPESAGLPELRSPEKTAIFLFASESCRGRPELFGGIQARYPGARIVGCTTAGEIFQDSVGDGTVSMAIAEFERARVETASVIVTKPAESFERGKALALKLLDRDLVAVFLLLDWFKTDATALLAGFNSVLPKGVVVTGAGAGDGQKFKDSWVLADGALQSGAASALAFYGDSVVVESGIRGGWFPIGPERTITRARGTVAYEFDGQPALALYKKYLGDKAKDLPRTGTFFPLRIRTGGEQGEYLRGILNVDEAQQSLICAGEIPQGAKAQVMSASLDQLIEGDPDAKAFQACSKNPALAIAISCVSRRMLLGARTEEETEACLEVLPPGARQVGFYAYGEIAPTHVGEGAHLYNQTMTLTVIQEKV